MSNLSNNENIYIYFWLPCVPLRNRRESFYPSYPRQGYNCYPEYASEPTQETYLYNGYLYYDCDNGVYLQEDSQLG